MINGKNYFYVLAIILVVFIMFMSFSISIDSLAGDNLELLFGAKPTLTREDALLAEFKLGNSTLDKPKVALLSSRTEDPVLNLLESWCIYNKYSYEIFSELPSTQQVEASHYELLLFGDLDLADPKIEVLEEYANLGLTMIFTKLPPFASLVTNPKLADFFGIDQCVHPHYQIDGFKVFSGFFLSEERVYKPGDDYGTETSFSQHLPYYILRPGYEVYSVGILQNQSNITNEHLPPILWRTYTEKSLVFVINGDFLPEQSILGILTGFLSKAIGIHLYPVINAQTIAVLNFPTFFQENWETINHNYIRSPQSFKRDILWPNIIKILRHYNQSFDFFVNPQLNQNIAAIEHSEDVVFYVKEIAKMRGSLGLSLDETSGVSLREVVDQNTAFFSKYFPEHKFTALYGGRFSSGELANYFLGEIPSVLDDVSLILTATDSSNNPIFRYITNDILMIQGITDGYEHSYWDDFQMVSLQTALALSFQTVDLKRALFPLNGEDNWSKLARKWSSGNTYFEDFSKFKSASIYDLETKIRRFLTLNYQWEFDSNKIRLRIDNFHEEAWFVLRTHDTKPSGIQGGHFTELRPQTYLIFAKQPEVIIELQEINFFPRF